MSRWSSALGALAWLLAAPALAQPGAEAAPEGARDAEAEAPAEEPGSPSRSIGVPDRGRLRDAVQLEETDHLFVRHSRRNAQFGTGELVGLITRAAVSVARAAPGPKLVVGDLSAPRGGRLSPHRSHRSGRDADIGFYLLDADGQTTQAPQFVGLRRDGCGRVRDDRYCFDAPRNFALLSALVQDPVARVQYVLIAPDIRRRVLAEGERQGAPAELMARIALVTEPHAGSHSHRSHFHVRIYCPVDDRPQCIDEPPYHDWYDGEPAPPTTGIRRMRSRQRQARARQRARAARRRAARERQRRARARARRERRQQQRSRRRSQQGAAATADDGA